jgi:membrane-bound lytic murein transglycosylase B
VPSRPRAWPRGSGIDWRGPSPRSATPPAARARVPALGRDEVAAAGQAFNQMADAIAAAQASLAERAAALASANAELRAEAVERERAERAARRQADRLATLHEIDRAILAARSPAEIAGAALRQLRDLTGVPRAVLALYDLDAGIGTWLACRPPAPPRCRPDARSPWR